MKLLELIATALAVLRPGRYILNENGQPVAEPDLYKWGSWFEKRDRILKQEWIGRCWVSTVFLGLDHNYSEEGPPILWETMVFGGPHDQSWAERCSGSREQAEAMHARMARRVLEQERKWVPFSWVFQILRMITQSRPAWRIRHLKMKFFLWKCHRYSRKDDKRRRKNNEI